MPRTTKKRTTARKKAAVAGPKKTIKISGISYQHLTCSSSKKEAGKAAEAVRKKEGRIARVVKNGSKYCVYKGRKRKKTTSK